MVDGTLSSFAYNVSASQVQAWWKLSADGAPSGAHWTLSLLVPSDPASLSCAGGAYPSINYVHYPSTNAPADQSFTSEASSGVTCSMDETTTVSAGATAQGTFSAILVPQGDAGSGSHSFQSGSYDVVVP
jgi:hypothetical protein